MYKIEHNKITFDKNYNETSFCEIIESHNMINDTKIDEIYFGINFNQDISLLPSFIKKIDFDYWSKFNHKIDFLPKSLTHLKLGYYFNQSLNNLPKGLTHLTLGYWFNQPIDNLPEGLTHLTLPKYYKHPLDHIPKNCKIKWD